MKWISSFQLFLFDFDGLLVNTEPVHYQAYINALSRNGYNLNWSFQEFCSYAHESQNALRCAIEAACPNLPSWEAIYPEKKEAYRELIRKGQITLMPGVESFLKTLEKEGKTRCIVTHSHRADIELIAAALPILKSIPHWITREDYSEPKPNPECYIRAIALHAKPGDRAIGFEDSLRGLKALQGSPAEAVLICSAHHPLLEIALSGGARHFESFVELSKKGLV